MWIDKPEFLRLMVGLSLFWLYSEAPLAQLLDFKSDILKMIIFGSPKLTFSIGFTLVMKVKLMK